MTFYTDTTLYGFARKLNPAREGGKLHGNRMVVEILRE